ncbi:MAG TPA: C25 family cysteine peptidase [Pirellulales bacterium]|nr:C25 family cysteine peptidase [Pirellulales bacterium]
MPLSWLLFSLVVAPGQADTVLVCPPALRAAIEPWRKYRSEQGYRIALVSEAVSAEETREEVRRVAKGGKLRFIVLVGDADLGSPRESSSRLCSVPTHYVPAKVNLRWGSEPEIATDNWYADLDDDQLPDVAIGRLSADTPEQLSSIVRKVISYELQAEVGSDELKDEWRRRINLVAGLGGFSAVIDTALEAAARSIVAGGIPAEYSTSLTHASWRSPYCPPPAGFGEAVLDRLNEGCLFWVYMGHGQPRELDRVQVPGREYSILRSEDAGRLAARRGAPVALFLACYTAAFDAQGDCLAEELLRAEGGPVGVIGGSRVTMPYAMCVLGIEMLKQCFVERRPTIGEILLHAKRNMVLGERSDERSKQIDSIASLLSPAGSDLAEERLEHVHLFNLLGDPLLGVTHPHRAQVESVSSVNPGELLSVRGTSPVDGTATVELTVRRERFKFRPVPRQEYLASSEADDEYRRTYAQANDPRLASVRCPVTGGKFEARLEVPPDARGDCHIRVFVQGRGKFAAGAKDVHIAAPRR